MQALRKTATVLLFPTLACLGVACEPTGLPTEPQSAAGVVPYSHGLSSASGTTRWVNDDDPGGLPGYVGPGTSCDDPGYQHVRDAVAVAGPGDRINVCPGTYPEQVMIPGGLNDLQLRSTKRWEAIIQAPTVMLPVGGPYTIVRISSSQNVTILGFTITGPGPAGCASLHYGVRVDNAGSANILGNHITKIRDEPLSGCQNGVAVLVGRNAEATTGSAQIMGNVIDNYQKNGPTVDNAGSNAEIVNNRIFGIGPTAVIAQNGIQVSRGATANVRHNFVAQNIYTPDNEATGILLYISGKVNTEHNTVTYNDQGIYMQQAAAGSTTTKNHVRASNLDGVTVDGSAYNQVADNKIEHNAGPGIGVYNAAQNNVLDDNHVSDNADSGILLYDNETNNTVSNNKVKDNGTDNITDLTDGIRINSSSMGNTISDNHLKNNVTLDCHDFSSGTGTAGTANTWTDNRGETSFPAALCSDDDDDADFATTTAYGWDASYPWSTAFGDAADIDWVAAYATIDTDSLLQLLPTIRVGALHGATPSPAR